jgi:FMN phosphatase YigB (HAD superfamily)
LFRHALERLEKHDIGPAEVLHVGSRVDKDIAPAKKLGLKTALFAGDRNSLAATSEQLKDPATRPDVLVTDLAQIAEIIS